VPGKSALVSKIGYQRWVLSKAKNRKKLTMVSFNFKGAHPLKFPETVLASLDTVI
jgi:hypothetical protein